MSALICSPNIRIAACSHRESHLAFLQYFTFNDNLWGNNRTLRNSFADPETLVRDLIQLLKTVIQRLQSQENVTQDSMCQSSNRLVLVLLMGSLYLLFFGIRNKNQATLLVCISHVHPICSSRDPLLGLTRMAKHASKLLVSQAPISIKCTIIFKC